MTHPTALQGRRVVVTRSSAKAGSLADLLRDAGAEPVVVPLVEQVPEPEAAAQLAALDPASFDWLVVTSPNGAEAYVAAHHAGPSQVAAVGATTASALVAGGVDVTMVPARQSAEGLLAEFPAGTGSVLLVQAVDAEPTMAEGLAAAGWQVTTIAPYRTRPALPPAGLQLAALSADAVLFASGSAVRAWVQVFGTATPPLVVVIGPRTAAAARGFDLKISLVATDHSLQGLVDALVSLVS